MSSEKNLLQLERSLEELNNKEEQVKVISKEANALRKDIKRLKIQAGEIMAELNMETVTSNNGSVYKRGGGVIKVE